MSNCLRALIGNRCVIHYRRDRESFIPKKPMKVQKVHAVHAVHVHELCKMITSAYPNSMANCKWPTGTVTCSATLTHICICLPNHVPCPIVRNSQLIRIQFVDIEALGAKRKLKKRLQLCDRLKVLHRHAKRSSDPAIQRSSNPTASWVLLIIVAFHPTSTSTVEAFNRSAVDSIVFALLFCLLSRTWQCAYSLPPFPRHSISLKSSPYSIISSTFSVLSCHRAAPLIVDCVSKLPLRG